MARMPGATWDGEHSPRTPMQRYDIVCIHTIVGRAPAHAAHLSTFMDGRPPHQSRDTAYRSAANLDGNHRVLAIENEDHGGDDVVNWPELTNSQVDDCARFLAFAHLEHGVPLQLCPDSRPGSRGLAYHRQGVDGNFGPGTPFRYPGRIDGGERWSSSAGKVCPTDPRIAQLPEILRRATALVQPTDPEETFMASTDAQTTLERIEGKVDALAQAEKKRADNQWRREAALAKKLKELGVDVDQVLAEVTDEA